jgi:hypothetical protein
MMPENEFDPSAEFLNTKLAENLAKVDLRAAASEALALLRAGDKQAAIERLTKTVEMWARRLPRNLS